MNAPASQIESRCRRDVADRRAAAACSSRGWSARPLRRCRSTAWFCRVTGFGGTPQIVAKRRPSTMLGREITVRFDSNVGAGLPWRFEPERNSIELRIGEVVTVHYKVINQAGARRPRRRPSYNVDADHGRRLLRQDQLLLFHQAAPRSRARTREMAVVFYVDPRSSRTTTRTTLNTITLSYTFYRCGPTPRAAASSGSHDDEQRNSRQALITETTMADAHAKHHDYHLVDPSPWPAVGAVSAFVMAVGVICWMHHLFAAAPLVFGAGAIGVLYTMLSLVAGRDQRGRARGFHTRVVQISHRYGMILFIASEVMFFVAWFWAYFNTALFPDRCAPCRAAWLHSVAYGRPRASRPSIPGICRCSTR